MALPAPGYLSDPNRTNAEMQVALEDQRDVIYGLQVNGKTELRAFSGTEDGQQASVLLGDNYMRVQWDAVSTLPDDDEDVFKVSGIDTGRWVRMEEFDPTLGAGTPIGGYVFVQGNLTGAEQPDPDNHILLTAGESDSGEYNEGKLISESVTGSAPLVVATAVIDDASSPMDGQTINLINTENRYISPGTSAGTVANDQMQQITGEITRARINGGRISDGALSLTPTSQGNYVGTSLGNEDDITLDSSLSPGARTGDHTNVKRIQVTAYMRYK